MLSVLLFPAFAGNAERLHSRHSRFSRLDHPRLGNFPLILGRFTTARINMFRLWRDSRSITTTAETLMSRRETHAVQKHIAQNLLMHCPWRALGFRRRNEPGENRGTPARNASNEGRDDYFRGRRNERLKEVSWQLHKVARVPNKPASLTSDIRLPGDQHIVHLERAIEIEIHSVKSNRNLGGHHRWHVLHSQESHLSFFV